MTSWSSTTSLPGSFEKKKPKTVSLCKKKIEMDSVEVEAVDKRVSTTATWVPTVLLQQLCCWKDIVDHRPLSANSALGHRKGDLDNTRGVWAVFPGLGQAEDQYIRQIHNKDLSPEGGGTGQ